MARRWLVVGAGFAGATVAERIAAASGEEVLVIDRRSHIGGNAYDEYDPNGVLIHRYGPHIFHTNSETVFRYLSQFTDWRPYEHRVLANVAGQHFPIPINRKTVNSLYGLDLDEQGVARHFAAAREPRDPVRTSEDVVLNTVGRDLYERFFRGYTRKQWGRDPAQLDASVTARIPVRTNDDDRYFTDTFQAMPKEGYTKLFERMLSHPKIRVELNMPFAGAPDRYSGCHVIYTGPLDEYFNYKLGRLPYRSLRFDHSHIHDIDQYQPTGTVNYPGKEPFTRITEFKHLTGQQCRGTSIVREYPAETGEPYYPVPCCESELLRKRYLDLAASEPNVTFVGRLAQYRYYNMDQCVAAALKVAAKLTGAPLR